MRRVLLVAAGLAALTAAPARAAPLPVTNTGDSGPGSLRAALAQADGTIEADTITVSATGTITLTSGPLVIGSELTITGPGAGALRVSGNDSAGVFAVSVAANATIENLTIADGTVIGGAGGGGTAAGGAGGVNTTGSASAATGGAGAVDGGAGVRNAGTLTLRDVLVTDNLVQAGAGGTGGATGGAGGNASGSQPGGGGGAATGTGGAGGNGLGGGILNTGTLVVERSTVTGNSAVAGNGGNADADGGNGGAASGTGNAVGGNGGAATANGGNGGAARGGGIYNAGILTLRETTVSGNEIGAGAGGTHTSDGGFGGVSSSPNRGGQGGTATTTGGAGGAASGAGIYNAGTATIEASAVTANTLRGGAGGTSAADGGGGGAADFSATGGDGGAATAGGAPGGAALGAGVANAGTLRVRNATMAGNVAAPGAAGSATQSAGAPGAASIALGGAGGTATAPTPAGGAARGGGIDHTGAEASLRSVTLTGNSAPDGANVAGAVTAINTILAEPIAGPSCVAAIDSRGFNLDDGTSCGLGRPGDHPGTDPRLAPLADNGGPTRTRLPQDGSPAIDAGASDGLTTDQRGQPRPADDGNLPDPGDGADIGAVELPAKAGPAPTPSPGPAADATAPVITSARLTKRRFKAGRGGALRFSLSEAGTVTVTVGRCRRSKRKPCARLVRVRAFKRAGKSGANTLAFKGRGLRPGRYRVTLRATDAAGNRSARKRVRFRVVAARRRAGE